MKVGDLYGNKEKTRLSFEFFPPRDEKAEAGFYKVVDDLTKLLPDYMSVTFGAGGSTREGSYQAVKKMITEKNLPTVAYIAGFGLGPDEITAVLDKYKELGVETIFVIREMSPEMMILLPIRIVSVMHRICFLLFVSVTILISDVRGTPKDISRQKALIKISNILN